MSKREVKPIHIEQLKMKAEYALLESLRDELRMIRQLMDEKGLFAHMPAIAEQEFPVLPKVEDLEREIAESEIKVSLPADVVNWYPENIKWEQAQGAKGPYERHPFVGQKIEGTTDYQNLRSAILAEQQAGKRGLNHKGMFYWLFTDLATIGRKPAKPFKRREP